MNIDEFYQLANFISSKVKAKYVSPNEFNLAAKQANLTLYGKKLPKMKQELSATPAMRDQKAMEDVRQFIAVEEILFSGLDANLPDDYQHPISHRIIGYDSVAKNTIIYNKSAELILNPQRNKRLDSEISPPTEDYPVLVGYDDHVELLPQDFDISSVTYPAPAVYVEFEYLRKSVTPVWAYTIVSGRAVYDAGNSVDFEWDEINHNDLLLYILDYMAINYRDPMIAQYIQTKKQEGI